VIADLILPYLLLIFIGNEKEDDLSFLDSLTDANCSESVFNSLRFVFVISVSNDNVGYT
jgi:hypothetical protein